MKELEDTYCETKKITEFHIPNWSHLNASLDDSERPPTGSSGTSQILGGFFEDGNYAWLSIGPKLIVINAKTGVNISSWVFRERIATVSAFPASPGEIPLLLVGLDNDASKIKDSAGMVCIFDCTISQVVRAIQVSAGVEQCCVITRGREGEELLEKLEEEPLEHDGLACLALRNLNYLFVDLKQHSWSNSINRSMSDESNPAEIADEAGKTSSSRSRPRERHSAHNLMNRRIEKYIGFDRELFESSPLPTNPLTTSLIYSKKISSLISGCQSRILVWHSSGALRWISPALPESGIIRHFALLEPTDDPRPFCYLWVASDTNNSISPMLRMYAMLFERKYSHKTANYYQNLEGEPSVKFELELEPKTRVTGLISILRDSNQDQTDNKRGEDNLLLISTGVKTLLFDLNQWYKEQMPRFLDDCSNPEAIFSSYSTNPSISNPETRIITSTYLPSTLREFQGSGTTTPEEFFHPNSLSLEWAELSSSRVVIWKTHGVQGNLLREISLNGPVIMHEPSKIFHECLAAGLIARETPLSVTESQQRDALLSLCLEQRWTTFLLRCARDWSDGSAAYLYPELIRWAITKASTIRLTSHQLCIPLFDQSGATIGEADVRTLRFFSQQMECLCNVVENLIGHSSELEQQKRTLRRISTYLQVLLWFYDVGLLPETQEDVLGLSFILKIPYPAEKLAAIYAEKRQQHQELFIDELITRECPALTSQWEQEATDTNSEGLYPPPSLQSLLRSCLIDCHYPDCHEMESKHQIIIYLLMDLVMMLQGSCPGVDQLIKYPSAFKLSPSVIKLTHALWFLDHENFQGFLDTMTGQLVSEADIKEWHHQLVMRTLLRSGQNKMALIYLRVRKPPLSSIDEQAAAVNLAVEHGLVQSAFHRRPPTHYSQLLVRFFHACKAHGKLNDVLQLTLSPEEEEAFVQFLESEKCEETRLIYYLQRCRWNEAGKIPLLQAKSSSLAVYKAYNATLPAISQQMSACGARKSVEGLGNYVRPMSHAKNRVKPNEVMEMVVRKARETFVKNDRTHIPFVSAPCLSLKGNSETMDKNCVLYVDRARKSMGKRTQEDMDGGEGDFMVRKRQKIGDECDQVNFMYAREMSVTCDTPLVKKKHFLIGDTDNQTETPHSILKIRQMIRDSVSPAEKSVSEEDEKILEKKSRQIRFSITQPKFNNSSLVSSEALAEESTAMDEDEPDELREIDSRSDTPVCETSDQDSNEFYSPNASLVSAEATAVLSDDSSVTKSFSGPRPRVGLKRSIFGKILQTSPSSPVDKNDSKFENTFPDTSCIVSSTLIDTPRLSQTRESFGPGVSMYSSTILSSDSSFELSRADPKQEDGEFSMITEKNELPTQEKHENNSNSDTIILDEKSSDKISEASWEETRDKFKEIETTESSVREEYCSFEVKEDIITIKQQEIVTIKDGTLVSNTLDDNSQEKHDTAEDLRESEHQSEEGESVEHLDEFENELVELKYEEEDDDVFKSLSNSMERDNSHQKCFIDESTNAERPKITQNLIHEELNMTDDESSASTDLNVSREQLNTRNLDVKHISQPSSIIPPLHDEINITDDETEDSFDVSTSKKSSLIDLDEESQLITTVNFDKSLEPSPRSLVSQSREDSPTKSAPVMISKDEIVSPESAEVQNTSIMVDKVEKSPPVRMTRSRRASSVAPLTVEPLLESQEVQRTRRSLRATSLVQEIKSTSKITSEDNAIDASPRTPEKRKRGRPPSLIKEVLMTSLQLEIDSDAASDVPVRRLTRRAASMQKEVQETSKSQSVKGSKAPAVSEDDLDEPVKKTTGRRAASVVKEVPPTRKTRAASVSNDSATTSIVRTSTRTRAASESQDSSVKAPSRRTRAASLAKETVEEVPEDSAPNRRQRAGSVPKKSVAQDDSQPRRSARTSSQPKEISGEVEVKTSRRVTRQRSATKELSGEALKGKKSSILTEVIPEEAIFDCEPVRRGVSREKSASLDIEDPSESKKTRGRKTRASSVDLAIEESSRRTRTRTSVEDDEDLEENRGKKGKKAGGTRNKRAVSETKEIGRVKNSDKPKRTRKMLAKIDDREHLYEFSAPEETQGAPGNLEHDGKETEFIFSPPHTRSGTAVTSQPRR